MAQILSITTKKDTSFISEAATILEGKKYSEINQGTYIGTISTNPIVTELKNLASYKKDKNSCGIIIYHGNVIKVS